VVANGFAIIFFLRFKTCKWRDWFQFIQSLYFINNSPKNLVTSKALFDVLYSTASFFTILTVILPSLYFKFG